MCFKLLSRFISIILMLVLVPLWTQAQTPDTLEFQNKAVNFPSENLDLLAGKKTKITVTDVSGKWGKVMVLKGKLEHDNIFLLYPDIPEKILRFYVDGNDAGPGTTNNNGEASVNYSIPNNWGEGTHTIKVTFAGDNTYNSSEGTGKLKVEKHRTTLQVADKTANQGERVTLEAYLRDSDNSSRGVSGKVVKFYKRPWTGIGDGDYLGQDQTDLNGKAILNYTPQLHLPLAASDSLKLTTEVVREEENTTDINIQVEKAAEGEATTILAKITIRAKFEGDSQYDDSKDDGELTIIEKKKTKITVTDVSEKWGKVVVLKAKLEQDSIIPWYPDIPEKVLEFYVDGKKFGSGKTNNNGEASVNYSIPNSWGEGTHTIKVTFAGDNTYSPSENTGELKVKKHDTNITVPNKSGDMGEKVVLDAFLRDSNNNNQGVGGRTLHFRWHKTFPQKDEPLGSEVTDSQGKATIPWTPTEAAAISKVNEVRSDKGGAEIDVEVASAEGTETRTIKVKFDEDSKYEKSEGEGKLTLTKKDETNISIKNAEEKWGKPVKLEAHLTTGGWPNKKNLQGKKVRFYLAGADKGTANTDENGEAYKEVTSPNSVGDFEIKAVFEGDVSYKPKEDKGKLSTKKHETLVLIPDKTGFKGLSVELEGKLQDANDNNSAIPDKELHFYEPGPLGIGWSELPGSPVRTDVTGTAKLIYNLSAAVMENAKDVSVEQSGEVEDGQVLKVQITGVDAEILSEKTIRVEFEGDSKYESKDGTGKLKIDDPPHKAPELTNAQEPPDENKNGKIKLYVNVEDPQSLKIVEVKAHYKADNNFLDRIESTKLEDNNQDGVFEGKIPAGGFFARDFFNDGESVQYWFTAKNSNGDEGRLPPNEGEYFTTAAVNGSSYEGLVVVDPGKNIFSTNISRDPSNPNKILNTITFKNRNSLFWSGEFRLNNNPLSLSELGKWNSTEIIADGATWLLEILPNSGDSHYSAVIGGNSISFGIFSWPPIFQVNTEKLTIEIESKKGSNDIVDVEFSSAYWLSIVSDFLQILFQGLDIVVNASLQAEYGQNSIYKHTENHQQPIVFTTESSEEILQMKNEMLAVLSKAIIGHLINHYIDPKAKFHKRINTIFQTGKAVHGATVGEFMWDFVKSLFSDPEFWKLLAKEAEKAELKEGIFKNIVTKLGSIATGMKTINILGEFVAGAANIAWKAGDFITLPPKDSIRLMHTQLLNVDIEIKEPNEKSFDSYPVPMQDIVKTWLIAKVKSSQSNIVVSVQNTSQVALSNVWIGVDIFSPETIDSNGKVTVGQKIENTYTPIKDPVEYGGTDKIGKLDFSAYRNGVKINETYHDPESGKVYGQGVHIAPGETIEFKAIYEFTQGVTGYNYSSGKYSISYALWHGGYPGNDGAKRLTTVDKLDLMLFDDRPPMAPNTQITSQKPFLFVAAPDADGTTISLGWTGVDHEKEADVVFYRIVRSTNINGPFNDIAWVPSSQSYYVDTKNLTPGMQYTYKISAIDNGGLQSVEDIVALTLEKPIDILPPSLISPIDKAANVTIDPVLHFYWNSTNNADTYLLQVSENEDFKDLIIAEDKLTSTEYQAKKNLEHEKVYYWRVKGKNSNLESDWSKIWMFSTTSESSKLLNIDPESTWNYGKVELSGSKDKLFRMQNSGSSAITISNISISGAHADQFSILSSPAEPFDIPKGKSRQLIVRFAPKTIGIRDAQVTISNNSDNASPKKTIDLKGEGIESPTDVTFSIPSDISTNPGSSLKIPLIIDPGANKVGSFNLQISFDPAMLTYDDSYTPGSPISSGWSVNVNPNHLSGKLDIGAFMTGGSPISKADTALVFSFTIDPGIAHGAKIPLSLSNVDVTDANANKLPVQSSDGLVTITSAVSISGGLKYFSNNTPLSGDTLQLVDQSNGTETAVVSAADGSFSIKEIQPGRNYLLMPRRISGNFPQPPTITAGDALKAFKGRFGGPQPLNSGYEILAADVNGDQRVTSGDALAILRRATGSFANFKQFGKDDWLFVDVDYAITIENAFLAPHQRIYNNLSQNFSSQDFVGIILGDVTGSFGSAAAKAHFSKSNAIAEMLSVSIQNRALSLHARKAEFSIELSGIEKEYNSFDLVLQVDQEIKVTEISLGPILPSEHWLMDWYESEQGNFRISAFSGSEEAIKNDGTLLLIKSTLHSTMQEKQTLSLNLSFAQFGHNGDEVIAQGKSETFEMGAKPPELFALYQNHPNPFNPSTSIIYDLSEAIEVNLAIYDLLGQKVRTLVHKHQEAGSYNIEWNGLKDDGTLASSGLYFYRLQAGGLILTRKLILIR